MVKCKDCKYAVKTPDLPMDFFFCAQFKRPMLSDLEIKDCFSFEAKK